MNSIDLNNRTAIITGGARGIGFAAARKLLASGAAVALWTSMSPRSTKPPRRSRQAGAFISRLWR